MKLLEFKLPTNFNLFLISDDHEGSILRDNKGWHKMVNMVESEYEGLPENHNYVIHHGDPCEGILIDDRRYDGITTEGSAYAQLHQCHRNMDPIKHKMLLILDGNHPMKLWRFFGPGKPGFTQTLAEERLEINYGTWASVITYKTSKGNMMFRHFAIHGAGRAVTSVADDPKRRMSNERLSLKRRLQHMWGDTILMTCGHWHRLLYCKPESELYMQVEDSKMKQKFTRARKQKGYIHPDYRHYVCCGSFLKTYGDGVSGYAEIAGYNPVVLGFAVVRVRESKIEKIDEVVV